MDECLEGRSLRSFSHQVVSDLLRSTLHPRNVRVEISHVRIEVHIFSAWLIFIDLAVSVLREFGGDS